MKIAQAEHDPEQIEVTLSSSDVKLPAGATSLSLWYNDQGQWLHTARVNLAKKKKAAPTVENEVLIKATFLASGKVADHLAKKRAVVQKAAIRKAAAKAARAAANGGD